MNEPSNRSPFAALTSQEQQERWLCWQNQHLAEQQLIKPTAADFRSESVIQTTKQTESRKRQSPGLTQYSAVVQRMRQAASKVQGYKSCSAEDSTVQPSSGS